MGYAKLIKAGLSSALVLGCMAPAMAFADTTGNTQVQWQLDDSAFNISVPTTFHGVAKADGSLQFADNAKFVNESIFDVYGTKYITAEADNSAVSLVESVTGDNQVAVDVTNTANSEVYTMGPANEHALAGDQLKLGKTTESPLTASGRVNADPVSTPTALFTVEWHFSTEPVESVNIEGEMQYVYSANNDHQVGVNIVTNANPEHDLTLDITYPYYPQNIVCKAPLVKSELQTFNNENTSFNAVFNNSDLKFNEYFKENNWSLVGFYSNEISLSNVKIAITDNTIGESFAIANNLLDLTIANYNDTKNYEYSQMQFNSSDYRITIEPNSNRQKELFRTGTFKYDGSFKLTNITNGKYNYWPTGTKQLEEINKVFDIDFQWCTFKDNKATPVDDLLAKDGTRIFPAIDQTATDGTNAKSKAASFQSFFSSEPIYVTTAAYPGHGPTTYKYQFYTSNSNLPDQQGVAIQKDGSTTCTKIDNIKSKVDGGYWGFYIKDVKNKYSDNTQTINKAIWVNLRS